MFPFWEMVVAPIVKASGARRVLEIGALRGETTAKMFDQLGPESELHVIDPLPQFDPEEHERAFPGRYVFHRDLSLNVLPDLAPMDVALVDGDHNWYTVFHELQALSRTAEAAGALLPVLVLHDVTWPYGHRDLYYEPSQIPEEFRQPWARAGMAPGFHRLLADGGFNVDLANAIDGGGPRNGVMKALEDFLEGYDRPYRQMVLPFYYGLAVVVDEERLAASPELTRVLDHFESPKGRERLLKLSERIRIDEQVHVHNWNRTLEAKIDTQRQRYLDLLKGALLDEQYLENEVRLEYLTTLAPGAPIDPAKLRDPARTLEVRFKRLAQARRSGKSTDEPRGLSYFPYTDMGRPALDHLAGVVAGLVDGPPGDLAECGVGRGGGGILMKACLDAFELDDRSVWMIDPYLASDGPPIEDRLPPEARGRADLNQVRDGFERFGVFDRRITFVQGPYEESLSDAPVPPLAVLRVGRAVGADLATVLGHLLPRVVEGGTVIVEGVGRPAAEQALAKVRADLGVTDQLERIDGNTVAWRVGHAEVGPASDVVVPGAHRPALPTPLGTDRLDLTMVVVFFNMRREAARTLQSLSRSYQRDIDDLEYEVLVVDNGSSPDQALTAAEVAAYGPEFRLLEVDHTAPSPTVVLNAAIAAARGEALGLMIDGAHVITPGVFRHAMGAMRLYEPAVVAVQQWYLGPGQQGDAQQLGYDQKAEDRLFNGISWPTDGYKLFEIGHFIGDRDWFDGIFESNCLFVPRSLIEQIGGFDDSFDMPGGGYTNLDLFERLHAHPGVTPTSILGEGSFHQFHGGNTTNVADDAVRRERVFSYGEHFRQIRGRPLQGLNKPVHYVGAMDTKAARRTRSRREITLAFNAARDPVTTTDAEPSFVPDEIKFAAIEAIWENQAWRETTWLGHPVNRYPTDLHSYQELLSAVRPAVVLLLGDDAGSVGRALHAASVADQLGHGRIIVVGRDDDGARPAHPRIDWVRGDAIDPSVADQVRQAVAGESLMVFIGLGATDRVVAAFEAYAPLVPVGSYVVIENTVVNGRPVVSGFGPGPHEAVTALLERHRDFVPDVTRERYTITFNKGGFLRRTARQ